MLVLMALTFTLLGCAVILGAVQHQDASNKSHPLWTPFHGLLSIWFFLAPVLTQSSDIAPSHFLILMVTLLAVTILPVKAMDAAFSSLSLHGMSVSGLFLAHVGWQVALPQAMDDLAMTLGGLALFNVVLVFFFASSRSVQEQEPLLVQARATVVPRSVTRSEVPARKQLLELSQQYLNGLIDEADYKAACRELLEEAP